MADRSIVLPKESQQTTKNLKYECHDDFKASNGPGEIFFSRNPDQAGSHGTISSATDSSCGSDGTEVYTDEDEQLYYDLHEYTNHGVYADDFLRIALGMSSDEYKHTKERINDITQNLRDSDAYRAQLKTFKEVDLVASSRTDAKTETDMYQPFVNMGNMILKELGKEIPKEARNIRLFYNRGRQVERNQRKWPVIRRDVLLVSKTTRKSCMKSRCLHIGEALSMFSFKVNIGPEGVDMDSSGMRVTSTTEEGMQTVSIVTRTATISMAATGVKRKAERHSDDRPKKVPRREEERSANSSSANWGMEIDPDPHGREKLASYAAAVLSDRGDRKFVYGVRVNASEMTIVLYHRAGVVEADAFDFCEHPEYLALFLHMFQRDPSTYGFNIMSGYCDPFGIHKEGATMKMNIKNKLVEKNEEHEENGVYDDPKFDEEEAAEYCIDGRGGSVCKAVAPNHGGVPNMTVKFCWQPTSHKHEIENKEIARRCIPGHVGKTYGHVTVKDHSPFEALKNACSHLQGTYTESTFRMLVMNCYRRLSEAGSMKIFWESIRQLVICLHILYAEENLLHRDIITENLTYEMANDKPVNIILDFDLATKVDNPVRTNEVRTGTAPFMARENLKEFRSGYKHTLNNDLESVYYIVGWHLSGYRGCNLPTVKGKEIDPLRRWRKGRYEDMCLAKENHMGLPAGISPFTKLDDSEATISMIRHLNRIRRQYKKRQDKIRSYYSLLQDNIEEEAIEKAETDAINMRLSGKERETFLQSKDMEVQAERLHCRSTTAISFKEWVIGSNVELPKDMDLNGCKRTDCCNDDLSKFVVKHSKYCI